MSSFDDDETLEALMRQFAESDGVEDPAVLGKICDLAAPPLLQYLKRWNHADPLTTAKRILLAIYDGRHGYVPNHSVMVWAFAFARKHITAKVDIDTEVIELVGHGFDTKDVAGILDLPTAKVVACVDAVLNRLQRARVASRRPSLAAGPTTRDGSDLLGLRIGNYRLDELIGGGGAANVFRATQVNLGTRCAVKVMRDVPEGDRSDRDRVRCEASTMAGLADSPLRQPGHENLVRVLDGGELPDGRAWYAMDLLVGQSLADLLVVHKAGLPWPRVAALVRQVCAGLGVAHGERVVHRDVKPANCFVVREAAKEVVKLLDFGIATRLDGGAAEPSSGAVAGTMHYLAPEVARGRPADFRADIYAVGVMMFEMLTGRLPFVAADTNALLVAKLRDDMPSFKAVAPGRPFPRGVEEIVRRAADREPERRYASVEQLGAAIAAIAAPAWGVRRERRIRLLAVASMVALITIVLTAAALKGKRDPPGVAIDTTLTTEHCESTLATATEQIRACGADDSADSAPRKASLRVLAATGRAIDVQVSGVGSDPAVGECLREVLFNVRFPRFDDARGETDVECSL